MDTSYAQQAFDAIYSALRSSSRVCAFHDGDILNVEAVREIAKRSNTVVPSSPENPLATLSGPFEFSAYFAAMWSEMSENFTKLHDALVVALVPGYLGYVVLPGNLTFTEALELFSGILGLSESIALRNGGLIEGTGKYGIESMLVDES